MATLFNFVLFGVFFLLGIVVIAFTAGQAVAVTGVWIPILVRLKNNYLLTNNWRPFLNAAIQVVILGIVLVIAFTLMAAYFPTYLFPFVFGAGFSIITSLWKAKELPDNLASVLQANRKYIAEEVFKLDDPYQIKSLFDVEDEDDRRPNEFFVKYLGDFVSHFFFYTAFVLFLFLVGNISWWIEAIGATIYGLLIVYSALHLLFGIGLVAVLLVSSLSARNENLPFLRRSLLWYPLGIAVYAVDIIYLGYLALIIYLNLFSYRS